MKQKIAPGNAADRIVTLLVWIYLPFLHSSASEPFTLVESLWL
jgi:hypothetical protein